MNVRGKIVLTIAIVVAFVVFLGYSVPCYYQLVAHQPGRAPGVTSFPPSYAFVMGVWFAVLSFIAVCVISLVIGIFMALFSRRTRVSGMRII
jgi:ABC-type Fe3+ transport system permease subunit